MFRVAYKPNARSCAEGRRDLGLDEGISLADIVGLFRPDGSVVLVIGDRHVSIDVCRDMYGFHRAILNLVYSVVFQMASAGPYLDKGPFEKSNGLIYSTKITDAYEPQYLFTAAMRDNILLVTRILRGEHLVAAIEYGDNDEPTSCSIDVFAREVTSFLRTYFDDLGNEFPDLTKLEEFSDYMETLEEIEAEIAFRQGRK